MKKYSLLVLAALLIMTPMSASALEALTDNNLGDITAQAGVSIAIDDVVIVKHIGSTSYIDTDGTDGTETGVVIGDKYSVQHINAITSADSATNALGRHATQYDYGALYEKARALSIDVGSCTALQTGNNANKDALVATMVDHDNDAGTPDISVADVVDATIANGGTPLTKDAAAAALMAAGVAETLSEAKGLYEFSEAGWTDMKVAGVVIGLPTIEIHTSADSYDVGIAQTGAINDGNKFIKIVKGASTMAVLSGTLEIAPH